MQAEGTAHVVEVLTEPGPEPVYNLYTAGEHSFIVEGCVVHNFTTMRVVRTWLHRWFIDPFHQVESEALLSPPV